MTGNSNNNAPVERRNFWFAAVTAAVYSLALLVMPRMGAGWYWSLGNGLGLAALACLVYLGFDVRMGAKVRSHQLIAYCALALLGGHALWFLLGDITVLEYAKIGAPWSMWSAWLAGVLLVFIVLTSPSGPRQAGHVSHSAFRFWHWILVIVLMAASIHHISGSGFYFRTWWQCVLLVALIAAALLAPIARRRSFPATAPARALFICGLAMALFALVRNLPL